MDGSSSLSRAWVLSVAIAVGLGLEASAAEVWTWPRVAWRRAASFAIATEDQVAEVERVLRVGMTQDEALAALDGKWQVQNVFGGDLLSYYLVVKSRRFRKADICLCFRLPPNAVDYRPEDHRLESWTVRAREKRSSL